MSEMLDVSVCTASYTDEQSIKDDYLSIIRLQYSINKMQTFDATIIHKNRDGKISVISKNEKSTGQWSWIGAISGLTTSLLIILFPVREYIRGVNDVTFMDLIILIAILAISTIAGAVIGAYVGHMKRGINKNDLKNIGKTLDAGKYALVVIALADASDEIQTAMKSAEHINIKAFKTEKEYLEKEIRKALRESDC